VALNNLLLADSPDWHEDQEGGHTGTSRYYNINLQAFSTRLVSRGQNNQTRIDREKLKVFHPYLPAMDEEAKIADALKRLAEEITG
ncbi:MAG: hypothetical protein WCK34_15725, partial [Bacteroidota bacterium]